jgi:DNA invertase Pin-like site-specific DNA recombinase
VSFIASLMDSRADFVIVELPEANRLTIHIMAAVAESEREMISKRTKEALAAAKARGVRLGNPQGIAKEAAARGRKLGQEARQKRARRFAERMSGTINRLRGDGLSLRDIAKRLNEEARGKAGSWTAAGVRRVLERSFG